MVSANFIELAIAYYKDKVQQELLEKFREESYLLLQADADARRTMAREDIKAMARLKCELEKFKFIYNRMSGICGSIESIDEYLQKIELNIKKLSYRKNNKYRHK